MKAYRFQARCDGIYFDGTVLGSNADSAAEKFAELITSKKILPQDEAFQGNGLYITYEEVDRDVTTSVGIEKTSIGVQVGEPVFKSGSGHG
jgi:hypothetical protein